MFSFWKSGLQNAYLLNTRVHYNIVFNSQVKGQPRNMSQSSANGNGATTNGNHEGGEGEQGASASNLESRPYLKDPSRIASILKHRGGIRNMVQIYSRFKYKANISIEPPTMAKLDQYTRDFKAKGIRLKDMDFSLDKVYTGRILNLKTIEMPLFGLPAVHLVAEDEEDGKAIHVSMYELEQDEKTFMKFDVGTRISVVNPYLRIAMDGTRCIRVDDPKCVFRHGRAEDMCNYCGREKAPHKCANCHRSKYCNRECQMMDWKVLKHKQICGLQLGL